MNDQYFKGETTREQLIEALEVSAERAFREMQKTLESLRITKSAPEKEQK
jgi:hypothetical protein